MTTQNIFSHVYVMIKRLKWCWMLNYCSSQTCKQAWYIKFFCFFF